MEQYIWENLDTPSRAGACANRAEPVGKGASVIVHQGSNDEASPPRTVVISDDEDKAPDPHDEWRRQLISALHDLDREAASIRPQPELEALPPSRQRPSLGCIGPSRSACVVTPRHAARTPRHRIGLSLLGLSAAAALLSAAMPPATNMPDEPASAARAMAAAASDPDRAPTGRGDAFRPVMFNSPVLVREGVLATSTFAAPVPPVIETVRTVPIHLSRRLDELQAPTSLAARWDERPEPAAAPQPAPSPAPLDRGIAVALAGQPLTSLPQALSAPAQSPASLATALQERQAAAGQPVAVERARPSPQISSYGRTASKTPRLHQKRHPRSADRTAGRKRQGQWETRRQGSPTTTPPEEPSTMAKLVTSLWTSSSKGDAPATTTARSGKKKPGSAGPTKSKNSFWWGEKESDR